MAEPAPLPLPPTKSRFGFLRIAARLLVVVSVVVVARELSARFDAAHIALHAGWLLAALLPAALGVFVQAVAFCALLERLAGRPLPWLVLIAAYLDAQMARYTPGKVGLLAVRVAAASRLGVSTRLMVGSLLIELASWAGVGVLVGFSTLAACAVVPVSASAAAVQGDGWGTISTEARLLVAGLAGASLVGLLILCFVPLGLVPRRARDWLAPAAGQSELERPLVPRTLPLWHLVHWACWVLSGAVLSMGLGASPAQAVLSGGVLCLAVVLGFLAVVAPAGAGVREVVISLGTAPILGPSAALVLGLTARVVSLLADVGVWAGVRLLAFRYGRAP